MKIFLSHSFDKKDKKVAVWFENFIPSIITGAEIVTAEKPELKAPWTKIRAKIDNSIAVVGLFTKNVKIEKRNIYKSKDWILSESSYAVGKKLPTFAFIEEGVIVDGITQTKEFVEFDRNDLDEIKEKAEHYLKSILTPLIDQTYFFESWEKKTTIFKSFHGRTEHIVDLRVTSNSFSGVKHSFALTNLPSSVKLPSWKKLIKCQDLNQFTSPTFFKEVFYDSGKKRKINVRMLPTSTDLKADFILSFKPNLKSGDCVRYTWGWSCPKLFLPAKQKDYNESCILATHPLVKNLILKLAFERGFPINKSPWIEIEDNSGNILTKKRSFSIFKNEPRFIVFKEEFGSVSKNVIYKGRWELKKK